MLCKLQQLACEAMLMNACRDPGSNRGPSDLQSDTLPTELSRLASFLPEFSKLQATWVLHEGNIVPWLPQVALAKAEVIWEASAHAEVIRFIS